MPDRVAREDPDSMSGAVTQHEFWRCSKTGEVWAIELVEGIVAGVCGPLDHSEIEDEFLVAFDYNPASAASVEAQRDAYELYDALTLG